MVHHWLKRSLILWATLAAACGSSSSPAISETDTSVWPFVRGTRRGDIEAYFRQRPEEFTAFKSGPVGNNGLPVLIWRLLPELMPEIWGTPDHAFETVGFGPDTYDPSNPFPLGVGFVPSPPIQTPLGAVQINLVRPACGACHIGRVLGKDGAPLTIVGGANNQFYAFSLAVAGTVMSPTFTSTAILTAINAKPPGWFYNNAALAQQEGLERQFFNAPGVMPMLLSQIKATVLGFVQRQQATLYTYTYAPANNPPDLKQPTFGYMDSIGIATTVVVDPAMLSPDQVKADMPPAPALVDIMRVWSQSDRPNSGWDGSLPSRVYRNLAAALTVTRNPSAINMDVILKVTSFTLNLPAAPYPYDVFTAKASRGEALFTKYCATCHFAGNAMIFSAQTVGTDANRSRVWTPYSILNSAAALRTACTDPASCKHMDGSPLADNEIINPSGGYPASALEGVWAMAPYLHNGSVPTLRALMTGDRPATFQRGSLAYNEKDVGFVWDTPGPGTSTYDTTKSGCSNTGHSTSMFLGDVDWKSDSSKLDDLLEYMKTL
jgi:mono/diheme cytochrome c family protein